MVVVVEFWLRDSLLTVSSSFRRRAVFYILTCFTNSSPFKIAVNKFDFLTDVAVNYRVEL